MTADIHKLVAAVPFTIRLAEGGQLKVATADHTAVGPAGCRVIFLGDDDQHDVISALTITRITVDRQNQNAETPH